MKILHNANKAFLNKDYQSAITLYEEALSKTPNLEKIVAFNLEYCHKKIAEGESESGCYIQSLPIPQSQYRGHLDNFQDNVLLGGWMAKADDPSAIFELTIHIDGLYFTTIKNDLPRADLVPNNISTGLGGFSTLLPRELFVNPLHIIEVITPDGYVMAKTTAPQKITPQKSPWCAPSVFFTSANPSVSVIVPIFNAADDLVVCIQRLLSYTDNDVDIILIDDASTDPNVQTILQEASHHQNIRVFHNDTNLGFTKTVNRGIELAGNNDVVFLNSDARVTPRWLQGLMAALATDPSIATVTPMSDRAGAFSAPNIGNNNPLPQGVNEADYAVAFRRRSLGFYPTVPTGNGFCLYVRRACLNEVGLLDEVAFPRGYGEENDFCMRARKAGWRHIIDDRTYVFHDRNKSFGEERTELMTTGRDIIDTRYPDYNKAIAAFNDSPLIQTARFRARLALKDAEARILPRCLFVVSTLTGGTPQTNHDLMSALSDRLSPWLLHCDRHVLSLYKVNPSGQDELIAQHRLKEPIEPLTHLSSEYDQVVVNWLTQYDFEWVHIRHLAWHSLNLPKVAKHAGARVIMSFHDFYSVCPTIKLLDNEQRYCKGTCTRSKGSCKVELWPQDLFPSLKNAWVYEWREKFKEAAKYCDAYVTTHQSAKQIIKKELALESEKFHVIPHGRDFPEFCQLAAPYKQGEVLKILLPGNIGEAKGSELIKGILEQDQQGLIEVHILGLTGFVFDHPRLILHGEYKRDDFAELVKKIKPHIGAVLSIWNETWCHTLTELWSVGLPVVVTDFPTVAQRVTAEGGGWVLDDLDPVNIYQWIIDLQSRPDAIKEKIDNVKQLQQSTLSLQTRSVMAKHYLDLYENRLGFDNEQ